MIKLTKAIIGMAIGIVLGKILGLGMEYFMDEHSFGRYVVQQRMTKNGGPCPSGKCLGTYIWKGEDIIHAEYDDSTDTMYRTAIMRRNQADSIVKALKMIQ